MKPFIPRPWQTPCVRHLIAHKRCALFAPPGSGKTSAVLTTLDALDFCGEDVYPALVIAPLRVARDTWPEEPPKWDSMEHLRVVPIVGGWQERLRALNQNAKVFSINFENIVWLLEHYGDAWPFKTVVVDEARRLKGFRLKQGSARTQALSKVAHKTGRWINLTGTPAPKGLEDLWGATFFLDFGQRLGRSYSAFQQRWFQTDYSGFGMSPLPHAAAEIHTKLEDICLSLDMRDYIDIKEPLFIRRPVKLPPEARTMYQDMEKKLLAEVGEFQVTAMNAAAKTNKCLQLANGAVIHDSEIGAWEEAHGAKLDEVDSLVEESGGMPLIVVYSYRSDLARLKKRFPGGADLATKAGMAAFTEGAAAVSFAHPASLGHGVDGLQLITNIMVFFGHSWDAELRLQIIERIGPMRQHQAGLDRPVFIYDIVAEDTLDDAVLARHASKISVQDALMQHLKVRRG